MTCVSGLAPFLGAITALALLSRYGWLMAFLCAPLGGTALALMIAR